jgi:hypothetical protein
MTGGEIGEAPAPTTTTTEEATTTTTTEEEPEIDEEAEKGKLVDALSLFTEGFWEIPMDGKKIKCCVSSADGSTELQDLNAKTLPSKGSIRVMGSKTGCGYMFGDTYHNGLEPFGERKKPTCVVSVAKVMTASGLELADVLKLKLPAPPEAEVVDEVDTEPEPEVDTDAEGKSSTALLQVGLGPVPEDWAENQEYACMQKWKDRGQTFENKFCLVKYDASLTGENIQYTQIDHCAAAGGQTMRVCGLKDEGTPNVRLSYDTTKKYLAKSCFRATIPGSGPALLETAKDGDTCGTLTGGEIGEARTTTTTTTEEATTTTTTEEEPEIDEEAEKGKLVDAVSLFTEGYWEFDGKKIKCCVSSTGKPTKMQDLSVGDLPSVGSARLDKKGCGAMFGDTYHNGLGYTQPKCVATVAEIMMASGKELAEALDLNLPAVTEAEVEPELEE